jgi:TRAP-type C4-dicarboxylate transport system substrate-binding protein
MKIRTNRNPVAQETFKVLGGVDVFVCETEDTRAHIIEGDCEGGETVYSRIYPLGQNDVSKTVLDTKHSLFLTTMIMRDDFWATLSPEVQAVIKDAAIRAGRREREVTIQDGEDAKQQLVADGIDVIELSQEETAEWKSKAQAVYEKFEPTFSPGLIDKIKKA